MKTHILLLSALIITLNTNQSYTQEWKNLKSYQTETGNPSLQDGCWLKRDRKKQTERWEQANLYNLSEENGYQQYQTTSQIRDFYLWFDIERKKQGHEIIWIGIAAIAAGQLSKLDVGFIRFFIVRDKEVVQFVNEGSKKVFEFAFPLLKKVYFSEEIIKAKDADNWVSEYGKNEQCVVLEPLYEKLSPGALHKLEKMAKGKGVFSLGIPKELKYEGKIDDCKARFEHGLNKILPYYLANQKNKHSHENHNFRRLSKHNKAA